MAERSGGNTGLALLVGALLVAVAGIGYMVWSGGALDRKPVEVELKLPDAPAMPAPTPMPNPQPAPAPVPTPG